MQYKFKKKIISIALGGSIVHPDKISTLYIKRLKAFFEKFTKQKYKFVVSVGGGNLARRFQKAAEQVIHITDSQRDWLGIHSTQLNAQLLRAVMHKIADPVVIHRRFKLLGRRPYPLTFSSGWKPGNSTDHIAAVLCKDWRLGTFVVAGKPDHVYSKDPRKYKTAKKLENITWDEYLNIIPKKWAPGMNVPIDPTAARFAKKHKLTGIVIDGLDLENFENLLLEKEFKGTIIS